MTSARGRATGGCYRQRWFAWQELRARDGEWHAGDARSAMRIISTFSTLSPTAGTGSCPAGRGRSRSARARSHSRHRRHRRGAVTRRPFWGWRRTRRDARSPRAGRPTRRRGGPPPVPPARRLGEPGPPAAVAPGIAVAPVRRALPVGPPPAAPRGALSPSCAIHILTGPSSPPTSARTAPRAGRNTAAARSPVRQRGGVSPPRPTGALPQPRT